MKPVKTTIFGTGFIGRVYLDAVRRLESVEVVALANPHHRVLGRGSNPGRVCLGAIWDWMKGMDWPLCTYLMSIQYVDTIREEEKRNVPGNRPFHGIDAESTH